MMRLSLLFALYFGSASNAFGLSPNRKLTQYVHRIWQSQPGLPPSSILWVTQSFDGYLLLGMESGVVRFDGVRFTPVPELEKASLSDIRGWNFTKDSKGQIWIASSKYGLVRVGEDGVKAFTARDGLPPSQINCVFATHSGDVWVCTSSGMARFRDGRFQMYTESLEGTEYAGCESQNGTIWFAGAGWLWSWNGAQFDQIPLRTIPRGTGVRGMVCRDDGVWIGTRHGLVQFTSGEERHYTKEDGLADSEIFSLAGGSHGDLWIGTRDGFSRLINGKFDSYTYRDGLSQKDVTSIYEDGEGSLWVATKFGLNQFLDGPTTRFTRTEGLPSNNVGPILEDRSGDMWVGLLDAGLARWNGQRFSLFQGFSSLRISSLLETSTGSLWVGTDSGLNKLESGQVKERFDTREGLPSNRIRSLYQDHTGKIWIGTERGAVTYQNGRFVSPEGIRNLRAPIVAIGELQNRHLLLATEQGDLYQVANGTLSALEDYADQGPLKNVTSIYNDMDGHVWIGTNGSGLRLLRDGKVFAFFAPDGLFDAEIYGFASDSGGKVWMACSKGFYSVAESDLLSFADKKVSRFESAPYIPLDGVRAILGRRGVQSNVAARRDGSLWFSSTEGIVAYDPHFSANHQHQPLPVLVEDVIANGKRSVPSTIHALGPGRQNMTFQYTSLSFLAPHASTFKYMLEGYDRDWTQAGTLREAAYLNIPAGKYRFRVTACAPFVLCNETGSVVAFEVAPSIYERTWFWPLIGILLGLLVWLIHRLRIAELKSKFSLILAERSRIARELHDTLIQGFSGITMQMQALSNQLRPSVEKQCMEDIILDAGRCLRETRQTVAGLRGADTASPELTEAIAKAAEGVLRDRDIRLVLKMNGTKRHISAQTKYNLVRIAREAVFNAAEHARASTVEVSLHDRDEELRLSVSDDGRGIENLSVFHGESGHYGVIGMRERARQIGAELDLASTPGAGTTVTVRLAEKQRRAHEGELKITL